MTYPFDNAPTANFILEITPQDEPPVRIHHGKTGRTLASIYDDGAVAKSMSGVSSVRLLINVQGQDTELHRWAGKK